MADRFVHCGSSSILDLQMPLEAFAAEAAASFSSVASRNC